MRIVAPLLILLSFTASMEHVLVRGLFLLRQDYVATHLCENRDRPELQCHGKCFLKKRMEDTHRHEEESGQQVLPHVMAGFNLLVAVAPALPTQPTIQRTYPAEEPLPLAIGMTPDVTHPPEHTA